MLVLVIMAQEGRPRTNVTSANQSRGSNRWSAILMNIPGSSTGMDKYCRNIGWKGILNYLKRKLLLPH